MGCDMVVALNQATVQGHTLVGINHHDFRHQAHSLCRLPGGVHAPDEILHLDTVNLPQVRRTFTILGNQTPLAWGLTHGLNEQGVVAGFCRWQSRVPTRESGLLGTELIRLALERSPSARQAMNVLTDLICRHGQRSGGQSAGDSIFLLADAKEAFVVEAAGTFWALLECQHVRAVSDACLIRQDWWRLSPGLAEYAISQGWWIDDGSKIDMSGCLTLPAMRDSWAHKRWGKAMVMIEQEDGQIDPIVVRRLLCDHFEDIALGAPPDDTGCKPPVHLLGSFVTVLGRGEPPLPALAWCSMGPASCPLFFPILLNGDLPSGLSVAAWFSRLEELLGIAEHAGFVKELLESLQSQFDQRIEEFLDEARNLSAKGDANQVARSSTTFMQSNWDLFETDCRRLPSPRRRAAVR